MEIALVALERLSEGYDMIVIEDAGGSIYSFLEKRRRKLTRLQLESIY